MKVRISVTGDDGRVFEGKVALAPRGGGPSNPAADRKPPKAKPDDKKPAPPPALSFSMNPRAFMKKYARDLSGDRKFTLFVSRLAKGSASTEVPLESGSSTTPTRFARGRTGGSIRRSRAFTSSRRGHRPGRPAGRRLDHGRSVAVVLSAFRPIHGSRFAVTFGRSTSCIRHSPLSRRTTFRGGLN